MSALSQDHTLTLLQMGRMAAGDESAAEHAWQLLAVMQSEDEELRAAAADALQTVEHLAVELAEPIAGQCMHPSPAVAAAACRLLTKLGDVACDYQAAVVACLNGHSDLSARQQAAWALGQMGALSEHSQSALRQAATSSDPRLRRLALSALGQPAN